MNWALFFILLTSFFYSFPSSFAERSIHDCFNLLQSGRQRDVDVTKTLNARIIAECPDVITNKCNDFKDISKKVSKATESCRSEDTLKALGLNPEDKHWKGMLSSDEFNKKQNNNLSTAEAYHCKTSSDCKKAIERCIEGIQECDTSSKSKYWFKSIRSIVALPPGVEKNLALQSRYMKTWLSYNLKNNREKSNTYSTVAQVCDIVVPFFLKAQNSQKSKPESGYEAVEFLNFEPPYENKDLPEKGILSKCIQAASLSRGCCNGGNVDACEALSQMSKDGDSRVKSFSSAAAGTFNNYLPTLFNVTENLAKMGGDKQKLCTLQDGKKLVSDLSAKHASLCEKLSGTCEEVCVGETNVLTAKLETCLGDSLLNPEDSCGSGPNQHICKARKILASKIKNYYSKEAYEPHLSEFIEEDTTGNDGTFYSKLNKLSQLKSLSARVCEGVDYRDRSSGGEESRNEFLAQQGFRHCAINNKITGGSLEK